MSKPKPQSSDVASFLALLVHPRKAEILALRQIILGTDPGIAESIKWNAPSFRTVEDFATMHLRAKDSVGIVLHLGAKKRSDTTAVTIDDPESLLTWLAKDRAMATFRDMSDVEAKRAAFEAIIRQWIRFV
jgi:hypothetical protein